MASRYEVEISVTLKGAEVDSAFLSDEDYGNLMLKIAKWASQSHANKDF